MLTNPKQLRRASLLPVLVVALGVGAVAVAGTPAAPATAAPATETTLEIARGTQKVLDIPNLSRIAIGDADVADVKTIGTSQLLLTATRNGKTTLIVWKADNTRLQYLVVVK